MFLILWEVEKIFVILFAERELFKHKGEINFVSLTAAVFAWRCRSKFRTSEQLPVFRLS